MLDGAPPRAVRFATMTLAAAAAIALPACTSDGAPSDVAPDADGHGGERDALVDVAAADPPADVASMRATDAVGGDGRVADGTGIASSDGAPRDAKSGGDGPLRDALADAARVNRDGESDAAEPAGDAGSSDAARGRTCGAVSSGAALSNTASLVASGFEDGQLAPFQVCTTQAPNMVMPAVLNGVASAKFFWTQTGYDGTRTDRGAEACSELAFYKEGWFGFAFYLPSPGFPLDKQQGIAQIFSLGGCSSWAAMLLVRNNDLWIEHRGDCASPPEFDVRIATDLRRNAWNPIIVHFIASHAGAGTVEVWYDDAVCTPAIPTYRKTSIDLAFGTWAGDSLAVEPSNEIGLKFGMYNFDDVNYSAGETRTIYYDNVTQLVGNPANAFAAVNPTR